MLVNTVNVTSVSITLFLLSCRADIVGSSENYCQDNQTWQYPHPICKSKCAAVYLILAMHVRECACVSLRPRGSLKINRRLHVGLLCVLTFVFQTVKTYMCRCVKLSKSKKETDTSLCVVPLFESCSCVTVLFCHLVAFSGIAWPVPH